MLKEDEILTLLHDIEHGHEGVDDDCLKTIVFNTLKSYYRNHPKDVKYECKVHSFIEFCPPVKYYSLHYKEIGFENVELKYCIEDQILNIKGKFYVYTGYEILQNVQKKPETIRFFNKNRTAIVELLINDKIDIKLKD